MIRRGMVQTARTAVVVVKKRKPLVTKAADTVAKAKDWFIHDSPLDVTGRIADHFWHARHRAFTRVGWRLTPNAEKNIDTMIRQGKTKALQDSARGDTRLFALDYGGPRRVIFNVRTRRLHTVLDPKMTGRKRRLSGE